MSSRTSDLCSSCIASRPCGHRSPPPGAGTGLLKDTQGAWFERRDFAAKECSV